MKELPVRKRNRLLNYDYGNNGAYFLTICTKDRIALFGEIVGAATCRPYIALTEQGKILDEAILTIADIYDCVSAPEYVIMPNHVHLIIVIAADNSGRQVAAPTIMRIVGNMKRVVSLRVGFSPWQKSFHDHVIRNLDEYNRIAEYIRSYLITWEQDCHYTSVTS